MIKIDCDNTLYTLILDDLDIKYISLFLDAYFKENSFKYTLDNIEKVPKENLDLFLLKIAFNHNLDGKNDCISNVQTKNDVITCDIYGKYINILYEAVVKVSTHSNYNRLVNQYLGSTCLKQLMTSIEQVLNRY